jgi:hypothetical protein
MYSWLDNYLITIDYYEGPKQNRFLQPLTVI